MTELFPRHELEDRIALARRNLLELMEQAAALSGAGDDERASGRIAAEQANLDALLQQLDSLPSDK